MGKKLSRQRGHLRIFPLKLPFIFMRFSAHSMHTAPVALTIVPLQTEVGIPNCVLHRKCKYSTQISSSVYHMTSQNRVLLLCVFLPSVFVLMAVPQLLGS